MSLARAVPDGLKNREAERGNPRERPPIPFVPEIEELEEKVQTLKVKISAGQEQKVRLYQGGTKETFLSFLQTYQRLLEKKGLLKKHQGYVKEWKNAKREAESHAKRMPDTRWVTDPTLSSDSEGEEDDDADGKAQPPSKEDEAVDDEAKEPAAGEGNPQAETPKGRGHRGKKKKKKSPEKDDKVDDEADEPVGQAEKDAKKAKKWCKKKRREQRKAYEEWTAKRTLLAEKKENARTAVKAVVVEIFTLYENLLGEDARPAWAQIVKDACQSKNWKCVLSGKSGQTRARGQTKASFDECIRLHVLTVFRADAAEKQLEYLQHIVKKPQRMSIRTFMERMKQLNNYMSLLPTIKDSEMASEQTERANVPLSEAKLAQTILRACPDEWRDQYGQVEKVIPDKMPALLVALEAIEKTLESRDARLKQAIARKDTSQDTATSKPRGSSTGKKRDSPADGKQKGKGPPSSHKKQRTEKYCNLCAEHGGAEKTHNTNQCRKYTKDGKVKADFKGKGAAKGRGERYVNAHTNDAQADELRDLKKEVKKLKKRASKREKKRSRRSRDYYSDSSDSDSE